MTETKNKAENREPEEQAPKKKWSRRKFLVRGGLGTMGVLALGTFLFRNPIRRAMLGMVDTMEPAYFGQGTEVTLWFEVIETNKVVFHSPKVEMGQGTFTGLAQMIADELDVSIDQIEVKAAETDTGVIDGLSTGGSLSVGGLWQPLRELSATLREMIKNEAASQLGVPVGELNTADGVVSGGGKSKTYAEVAAEVSQWEVPSTPELRPTSQYKHVGKPVPRIDLQPKVFGDPIFGMDAEMPDMLHAAVVRPEHVGAKFKSADTSAAESMPGVVKIVQMEDWVGVVAETFPQALAAKRKIKVEWDVPKTWSEDDIRDMLTVGKGNEMITQMQGSALSPDDDGIIEMEFTSPLGAHAQIEPNGAVASVKDGKATVIISTQVIGITRNQVAEALGFSVEDVNVVPTYLGGGFGRRLSTPHAIRAAVMSRETGKPVKYFFTRKEEFQHDTFRPPTHHVMRGKLNNDGLLEGLEHHYASGDVAINSLLIPGFANSIIGADIGAMRGGNIQYDKVQNHRSVQWHTTLPFATSWWRSLGLLANTFAIESFVDEIAIKAGADPAEFRLAHLSDDGNAGRIKAVINKAVKESGYVDEVKDGRAMGIAASIDSGSPCAHVVEVSIEDNRIKVHKVTCVLDCGLVVNPDQVAAQCEGCIIMGISGSMHEKMTLRDGKLYPTIYGPYDMALIRHAPDEIDVHFVQGADKPLPVGEPPMGPIAAAIGNAVRRLTGNRITDLPMKLA
ncbi:MAG: molybdopterin cofactor-binding domain-containing protein [Planctomycetota bacterium]